MLDLLELVRCEPSNIGAGNQTQALEEQQVLSITEPSDQMTGWGVWGGRGDCCPYAKSIPLYRVQVRDFHSFLGLVCLVNSWA